jgi:hypothetical protein
MLVATSNASFTIRPTPIHPLQCNCQIGGIGIATNRWFYTNVTSVVNMGGWFETNSSFGLCATEVKADAATNSWLYTGRGFPHS